MHSQQKTHKLYYKDPFLKKCSAVILDIHSKGIVLDRTVAFPEGGGQEGDRGVINIIQLGRRIPFCDTQKGLGRVIYLDNFPTIQVNLPIYHVLEEEELLQDIVVGMKVEIEIDVNRRNNLAASHTATHLMLMGVESIYGQYESRVYGCHIKEDSGRLDFRTTEKFSAEIVKRIENYANDLIDKNHTVRTFPHPEEKEAWYWECNGVTYPCGGMHILNTSAIGHIKMKRKNLGKNGQRISFTLSTVEQFEEVYHDSD